MTAIPMSVNNVSDGKIAGTDDNPPGKSSILSPKPIRRKNSDSGLVSVLKRVLRVARNARKK